MRHDMTHNFFKKALTASLSAAFLLTGTQSALAQISVTDTSSSVTVQQIGDDNFARIQSSGNNVTSLFQNGSGHIANIEIEGFRNGTNADEGTIDQTGQNNLANVTITGDDNLYDISQSSGGALNVADLTQDGNFNTSDITQDAASLRIGLGNLAEVNQIGNANFATVDQTAFAASSASFNNQALINQTGDDNLATSTQLGINNISEQEQEGDRNTSEILQTGNDNLAIHRQFGNDLSLASSLGGLVIEQSGGAEIIIEQYGAGQVPPPF